ncbi:MAG: TIGR04084 family radical SAM/SPASM domain-containing protein [Candidatus Methanoperedenaceae archaeon]|nr:TIGR04084 family radical SAM/SPASM domain-containing protein [Candidatus Methanoperedenaceae archaeon]
MHYHIILTKECNLECTYCGGGSDTEPGEMQYSIPDLKQFILKDENPVLEFYGGEPLLRIRTMQQIMREIPAKYVVQTNGIFLDKIEPEYIRKFHSILVSIDGTKDVTDRNRSGGLYDWILENIKLIRERGFSGDLVARMTVPRGSDIFGNVLHLLSLNNPGFDHVHWQMGFEMFWEDCEPGVETWIKEYNSGITSLVKWWVSGMERTGKVPGIVPFIGITCSLLKGRHERLRCGSGIDFFAIMPDGRISACPVSIDYEFSVIGSIFTDEPSDLCNRACVKEPCTSCDIFTVCGGRCLFVNHARDMLMDNGYEIICSTVRHLVTELKASLPTIRKLIQTGVIDPSVFEYPELNNGCEIIP